MLVCPKCGEPKYENVKGVFTCFIGHVFERPVTLEDYYDESFDDDYNDSLDIAFLSVDDD
jgi:hypothetical protein